MNPDITELDIIRLGAQGDGVADTPSGPVYVPYALPGERVTAIVEDQRARSIELQRPGPETRADPVCRHFGLCGGCAAQHMPGRIYDDWKRGTVVEAFAHRGLDPSVEPMVRLPYQSRRRVVLTARRADYGPVQLGYHEAGSHRLVDIATCPILIPALHSRLDTLRAIADVTLGDRVQSARLTACATDSGLDVEISQTDRPVAKRTQTRLTTVAAELRLARLTLDGEPIATTAAPQLSFGSVTVCLPPAAFIQASADAEQIMRGLVVEAVGNAKRVCDLFAGLGTFTFALARTAKVLAIDSDKPSVAALATAARGAAGLKPITTLVRDLMREPLSRRELQEFDVAVFDPPRVGAKAQAEAIAKSAIRRVVAVSCNPATLARDVRILVDAGFKVSRVTPIDQFVFSPHVEVVAVLERPAKPGAKQSRP